MIFDSAGKHVRLRGIDTSLMGAGPPTTACPKTKWKPIPATEIAAEAADGFNEVRIAISWANLEPSAPSGGVHHWDAAYVTAIAAATRAYNHAGLAVVLDFHEVHWSPAFNASNSSITKGCQGSGVPLWAYPNAASGLSESQAICDFYNNHPEPGVGENPVDGLSAAESYLADYFSPANVGSHGRVIAFDMLNEPKPVAKTTCSGQVGVDMLRIYAQIGAAIRAVNASATLIYEDYAFESYTANGFLLSSPLAMPNVIYSSHAYPATWDEPVPSSCPLGKAAAGLPYFTAHVQHSTAFNQPLWIGEFNAFGTQASCPDANAAQDASAELAFCAAHDVGWSFWSFRDLSAHAAVLPSLQAALAKP